MMFRRRKINRVLEAIENMDRNVESIKGEIKDIRLDMEDVKSRTASCEEMCENIEVTVDYDEIREIIVSELNCEFENIQASIESSVESALSGVEIQAGIDFDAMYEAVGNAISDSGEFQDLIADAGSTRKFIESLLELNVSESLFTKTMKGLSEVLTLMDAKTSRILKRQTKATGESQKIVLDYILSKNYPVTPKELVIEFNWTEPQVRGALSKLKKNGKIVAIERGKYTVSAG